MMMMSVMLNMTIYSGLHYLLSLTVRATHYLSMFPRG